MLFFIHFCLSITFDINYFKLFDGVSGVYIDNIQSLFWLRVTLKYTTLLLVVIFFFLSRSSIKWLLLLYVVWLYMEDKIIPIRPNAPEFLENYKTVMKSVFESPLSWHHKIKRFYLQIFVPLLCLSALLYSFASQSKEWRKRFQNKLKGVEILSLLALIFPLIPVALILFFLLMRTIIVYDIDAPIFLTMVYSIFLFVGGAILSVVRLFQINKREKSDKTFLIVGAVLNISLLFIGIVVITSIRF